MNGYRDKLGRFAPGTERPIKVPKIKKNCIVCGKEYWRWPSRMKAKRNVCCWECYKKSKKGEIQNHLLNEKVRHKISKSLTGKPQPWNKNKKHPNWKGNKAGYTAFHQWIRRHYGKANHCENPDCRYKNPKRYEWALIHGYEHDHKRKNYWQLCKSCHVKYDLNKI
jgi:hypothetical protein